MDHSRDETPITRRTTTQSAPPCGGPIAQTAIPAYGRSRTYVATRRSFVDVAFVIDVLSRRIVEPPRVFRRPVQCLANQSQLAGVVAGFAVSIRGRIWGVH